MGAASPCLPALTIVPCLPTFPGGSDGKESACNAGDLGVFPGLGRASEEGNIPNILPWKIPSMKKPGELQSMGSQRV